jgi:hypothetical protein
MRRRLSFDRPKIVPTGPLELDTKNSLAEGLRFLIVSSRDAGGNLTDMVRPRPASGSRWLGGPAGLSAYGGFWLNSATTDLAFTSGNFCVFAYFFQSAALASGEYFSPLGRSSYTSESVNSGWELDLMPPNDASPDRFSFTVYNNNGGGNYRCFGNTNVGVGLWTLGGRSVSGGSIIRHIFVNGRNENGSTLNEWPATTTGNLFINGSPKVQTVMACAWARALSDPEFLEMHQRPFGLLRTGRKASWFLPKAVTGGLLKRRRRFAT